MTDDVSAADLLGTRRPPAHHAGAAVAAMIVDPESHEKRVAAIEALIVAPDDVYEATINAFVFCYPDAEPLRVLLASLRASNKRRLQ
jgi:hypothetical protein